MKTIRSSKDDLLLHDIKNFFGLFRDATLREQEKHHDNFRSGLLRLRNGFATIYEQEKPQRVEEFRIAFTQLISSVKQMQERGLWRKYYFNIFETLEYQRRENIHSNLLAWLLNPEESHGIGEVFLRSFVEKVFNIKDLPANFPVKVFREKQEGKNRHIYDIVVEGNNWWLVIENKIDSEEQEGQTKGYAEDWRHRGILGKNVLLAYINPTGRRPESSDFTPVSYRTIRGLLKSMKFQGDSNVLINHFIDHISIDFGG